MVSSLTGVREEPQQADQRNDGERKDEMIKTGRNRWSALGMALILFWLGPTGVYPQDQEEEVVEEVNAADEKSDEVTGGEETPEAESDDEATTPLPLEELRIFTEVFARIKAAYVEQVSDEELLKNAIQGMLSGLDPHSVYLDDDAYDDLQVGTEGRFGGLGIEVTTENGMVRIISPIDDTPAARAGLKSGDYIVRINDKPVRNMPLDKAIETMRGEPGTDIVLGILREGESNPFDVTITRAIIRIASVRGRMLEDGIGYLRVTQFQSATAETLRERLRILKDQNDGPLAGLVLDLRNNPGGLLNGAVSVVDAFISEGEIVSTKGRIEDAMLSFSATKTDYLEGAPIVVLVNGGSASAAEIVAGALQDHKRAIIMGTTTFGKGSVQTILPVAGDGAVKLTTARYYTPLDRSIQAEGIIPDIIVPDLEVSGGNDSDRRRLREADLPGHLDNEDVGSNNERSGGGDDIDDYQLNEAVNLLRGILVYKEQPSEVSVQ